MLTNRPFRRLPRQIARFLTVLCVAMTLSLSACVYKIDIQQGNKLDADAIDQIEIGMTRSQVRYLLGSPVVSDTFQENRWDYMYYFKGGRAKEPIQQWLVIEFEDGRVSAINRDVEPQRE